MMKRLIAISFVSALMAFMACNGAEEKPQQVRKMDPEVAAKLKAASYRAFGGQVRKPGTARGKVAFLNAQKRIPASEIRPAVDTIDLRVHPDCKFEDVAAVDTANPRGDIAKRGGTLGVVIVDDAKLPALLVAPEEGWGVVNVAPLAAGCSDSSKVASRVRKEILRAFGLVGGCAFMCRAAYVMRDATTPAELDAIPHEEYGVDALNCLGRMLPTLGVTPWYQTNYRSACKEGWAPSPTNDVQKKIWDKVHALPTNPIQIKYDPKRDK